MAQLVRMTEAGALGLHAMVVLAANESAAPGRPTPTQEIADTLAASPAHLSKVLQRLAGRGIVASVRGPGGGFRLTRPSEEITLLEVYEAIEGDVSPSGCLFPDRICSRETCIMGGCIERANREIRKYLAETRLASLVTGSMRIEPALRQP